MTMTDIDPVPSLREHLDREGGLDRFAAEELARLVVLDRRSFGMDGIAARVAKLGPTTDPGFYDGLIEKYTGKVPEEEIANLQRCRADARRFAAWEIELSRDEDLCDRVEATLPYDLVSMYLEYVDAEVHGRQYRLAVRRLDTYRCGITGEECHGPAVVVEGTTHYLQEPLDEHGGNVFSPEALRTALALVESLEGDDK